MDGRDLQSRNIDYEFFEEHIQKHRADSDRDEKGQITRVMPVRSLRK